MGIWIMKGFRRWNEHGTFPSCYGLWKKQQTPWLLVRKRTIPTRWPSLVGEFQCQLLRIEGGRVVSATGPHGRQSRFSTLEPLILIQVAPQLYSRCWVGPLIFRKSGSAGDRIWDLWVCSQELWLLGHRGGRTMIWRENT
jgi:hypothetical protein